MRKKLSEVDWDEEFSGKTVEEMWTLFKDNLQALCSSHIPCRNVNNRKRQKTWMTKATKKLLKNREEAWKKYRNVCSTLNYEYYKSVRNKVSTAIRGDKASFQLQLVKSFRGNPKRFYGYVRRMQTVKTKVGTLQKLDGSMTETDKETAEVLCAHFQNVFVHETGTQDITSEVTTDESNCLNVSFDEAAVLKKLHKLKPDKSQETDEIHPMVLLRTAEVVAKPLSTIFEALYNQGILPADWKCANISPIFKKGSKSDVNATDHAHGRISLVVDDRNGIWELL